MKKTDAPTTYHIYFAPGQQTKDGISLYNRYCVLYDTSLTNAKERMKNYWKDVKAFLSEDLDSARLYGMKVIDLDYELKLNK